MSKLLITGSTGFVGSHVVEEALAAGHEVYALVRSSSNISLLKKLNARLVFADVVNVKELEKVFQQFKKQNLQFDAVIHCAGVTKAKDWETYQKVNAEGTRNLIEGIKQYQKVLPTFIFTSSLAASGPTTIGRTIQVNEEQPVTEYGKSKLEAEEIIRTTGIPHVIFRPTAVYGPREKDLFELFKIIGKGWHPLIGRHPQELTFIYIKDLVELLLKAAVQPASNTVFFATDGRVYHKKEIGEGIAKAMDKKMISFSIPLTAVLGLAYISQFVYGLIKKIPPLNPEKFRELSAESWACEIAPTFDTFSFQPQYDLEKGLLETTKWYKSEGWL